MRKAKQAKPKEVKPKAKPQEPQAAPPDEVLDLTAAADFLKVSKPTFYRWLAQERIKGFKAGTQWRFYRKDLQTFLESEEPEAALAETSGLLAAIAKARKKLGLGAVDWPEAAEVSDESVAGAVNTIIADAIEAHASDIHMESDPDAVIVRYRVDGVLTEVMRLPRDAHKALMSRIKLLADMNIAERRLPQNGRIHIRYRGREFDLRPTTVPAVYGESAVLRILDQNVPLITFDVLGISKPMQQLFERLLRLPQGLIIVAGPAGSGKTTTLYSTLNLVNSPRIKILTIENPVEYFFRGITQVHINRKAGLTYPVAMRTFARCDPDIILVGEVPDLETAEGCVNAAMTGHLVLTTMLPQDAPSVVTRLIDMGVEPFLVASSLVAVLAQRLVRRVCEHCKEPYQPDANVLRRLYAQTDLDVTHATFVRGKGCKECRQTGHRGRTGVFELLEVNDRLRELIAKPASTEDLRAAAIEGGMTTLLKDGVEKAMQGITTVEEVMRVLAH